MREGSWVPGPPADVPARSARLKCFLLVLQELECGEVKAKRVFKKDTKA